MSTGNSFLLLYLLLFSHFTQMGLLFFTSCVHDMCFMFGVFIYAGRRLDMFSPFGVVFDIWICVKDMYF